jgi:hypothetical protein
MYLWLKPFSYAFLLNIILRFDFYLVTSVSKQNLIGLRQLRVKSLTFVLFIFEMWKQKDTQSQFPIKLTLESISQAYKVEIWCFTFSNSLLAVYWKCLHFIYESELSFYQIGDYFYTILSQKKLFMKPIRLSLSVGLNILRFGLKFWKTSQLISNKSRVYWSEFVDKNETGKGEFHIFDYVNFKTFKWLPFLRLKSFKLFLNIHKDFGFLYMKTYLNSAHSRHSPSS